MDYDESLPWRDAKGSGFNTHVGPIRIARAGDNEWHTAIMLDDRHINVGGVCHGGMLMTMADLAMGAASFDAGGSRPCATIEMDCHFIAAAKKGQRLMARARQLRLVRDLSFMEAELHAGGRQVMRASGIWKYLAAPPDRHKGP